ncbi:hypothetical protein [Actinocorallia lasiicapitis]
MGGEIGMDRVESAQRVADPGGDGLAGAFGLVAQSAVAAGEPGGGPQFRPRDGTRSW